MDSFAFAGAARRISAEARRLGLAEPVAYRSPPRRQDVNRSIRRLRSGGAVVAIRIRDRSWDDVVADMVEGALMANGLAVDHEHRAALVKAAG